MSRQTLVGDIHVVGTELVRLIVERLRDVADKVDQELERLGSVGGGEASVANALGVVDNGRHGTARRTAVPVIVDIAAGGRVILGIDKVQRGRPGAGSGRTIAVGPRGNVGEVRVRSVTEQVLRPGVNRVSETRSLSRIGLVFFDLGICDRM